MAEQATIARPYAAAAFGLVRGSQERIDAFGRMLEVLAAAVTTAEMKAFLARPAITAEHKARALVDMLGDRLDERGRNLVHVLAQNRRLDLLPRISEQFEALRAEALQTLDVDVRSAFELSREQQAALQAALVRRFARAVRMTATQDPELIGGVIVRAGDVVIDASVQGSLQKLKEALARA
jgi:F-type H+-transporting ATPase subunit delta